MTGETKWKTAGLIVALIPIGFFLFFTFGEGLAMGWSHLLQAAVPVVALALAWWSPRIGGYTFAALGLFAGAWYAVEAHNQQLLTIVIVECITFVPMLISGVFFLRAARIVHSDTVALPGEEVH